MSDLTLVDQLQQDQCDRWRSGMPLVVEEYLYGTPKLENDKDAITSLAFNEFRLRDELGKAPPLDVFLARFSRFGCSSDLVELIDLHSQLKQDEPLNQPKPVMKVDSKDEWPCIPGYQVLSEINIGAMGIVYIAHQEALDRKVALKLIREGQDDRRFRVEAEVVATLDHPNIVKIHEFNEHGGQFYLSMEYISGGSLSNHLKEFCRDIQRAAKVMAKAARAVHYAHQRGILHRDLKPSNIMLDEQGEPRLMDFGLAKRLNVDEDLTMAGVIVGTANYMPPEQTREGALSTLSDVYSLGATLYELLTGRPPFRGKTLNETLMQVREKQPSAMHGLNSSIDADLEAICLKCLNKEPTDRYQSAEAIADDLERWLKREPIRARSISRSQRFIRWCRRNPGNASLALTLLVVLAVSATTVYLSWQEAQHGRARAEQMFAMANETTDPLLSSVRMMSSGHMAHLDPDQRKVLERMYEVLRALVDSGQLSDQLRTGQTHRRLADTCRILGKLVEAETEYLKALEVLEDLHARIPSEDVGRALAQATNGWGMLLFTTKRLEPAELTLRKALSLRTKVAEDSHRAEYQIEISDSLEDLGYLLTRTGRRQEGDSTYEESRKLLKQLTETYPNEPQYTLMLADSFVCHGIRLENAKENIDAEAAYRQAIEYLSQLVKKFPRVCSYGNGLSIAYGHLCSLMHPQLERGSETARDYAKYLTLIKQQLDEHVGSDEYRRNMAITHGHVNSLIAAQLSECWRLQHMKSFKDAMQAFLRTSAAIDAIAPTHFGDPELQLQLALSYAQLGSVPVGKPDGNDELKGDRLLAFRKALEIVEGLLARFPNDSQYLSLRKDLRRDVGRLTPGSSGD